MSTGELELRCLTARQRLVAELIADGHMDKEICSIMHINRGTVTAHLQVIAMKLNLDRTRNLRVQLAWLVIHDRHLTDPDHRLRLSDARKLGRAS